MKSTLAFSAIMFLLFSHPLFAYAKGNGPVMTKCKTDIEKYCADKKHVKGEVRSCLEEKKAELTEECKMALESTGPGKGKGKEK